VRDRPSGRLRKHTRHPPATNPSPGDAADRKQTLFSDWPGCSPRRCAFLLRCRSLRLPGFAAYRPGHPWPCVRADILTFSQDAEISSSRRSPGPNSCSGVRHGVAHPCGKYRELPSFAYLDDAVSMPQNPAKPTDGARSLHQVGHYYFITSMDAIRRRHEKNQRQGNYPGAGPFSLESTQSLIPGCDGPESQPVCMRGEAPPRADGGCGS
jgi:hypothetical protein